MPLFGKSPRGKWYEITLPEGEEFILSDTFRDRDYNEMPVLLKKCADCPDQPESAKPVVINRPELDLTSAGAISGPEGLVERPVASENVESPQTTENAESQSITDVTSDAASEKTPASEDSPSENTGDNGSATPVQS